MTPSPRSFGIRSSDREINRDDEFAIANDDHEQDPINATDDSFVLATVPAPDELKVLAVFAKHRVIPHPAPLPATLGGGTHGLDVTPEGDQDVLAKLAQPFDPGAFGQSTQHTRGQILIPAAHAGEFIGAGAAKEGGKHEAKDFAQEFLLGFQAPFDLHHEMVGQAHIVEGLMQRVDGALGVLLLAQVAGFGVEAAALSLWLVFWRIFWVRPWWSPPYRVSLIRRSTNSMAHMKPEVSAMPCGQPRTLQLFESLELS